MAFSASANNTTLPNYSCASISPNYRPSSILRKRTNFNYGKSSGGGSRILSLSANASAAKTTDHPDVLLQHQQLNPGSLTSSKSWEEFAKNVSGEWDGFGADFTIEGVPIELPESVVPEAYREWEVKVYDWQTQCPTLAQPDDFVLVYKLIKLLPTVGCEADAATRFSIDERLIDLRNQDNNQTVSAFAYQSSGCYVAVWPVSDRGTHKLMELEHCLVDPRDKESRVRISQIVRVEDGKFKLESIKVFCELWYGPFRNGDQLGGCAIRDSAFASTQALKGSEVTAVWQGLNAVANFENPQKTIIQELQDDTVQKSVRDENNLILLPKQLWCSLIGRGDGETCFEVGWLLEHGRAITSRCVFSESTKLKDIAIASETTASI